MSFRLDMHQTVQDIITKKQRLQFETQRLEALASGHFFKAILPIMCDNGVITERRFMELVLGVDTSIESKVATKELLQLAVLWGVTRSPSEFWQTHRSRAELIEGLQRAKSTIDSDAKRQQEVQEREIDAATVAHDMSEDTRLRQRRASLVNLKLLAGQATYSGDLFSSRGAYEGGALYLSRRGKGAPAAASSDPGAALRGRALRRRGAAGPGATSTTSEEDDLDEIAAIAALQRSSSGVAEEGPDAEDPGGGCGAPPEGGPAGQPPQPHLARTSSEVELPPPSARAEWVATLRSRLSPSQSPRSGSPPSEDGGREGRPPPMTVESFVSKYSGGDGGDGAAAAAAAAERGGGEELTAAAEAAGAGAGATSMACSPAAAPQAATGGGDDATAAAFRRYVHMMAQLPAAAPGASNSSNGTVRMRATPRSTWAGKGLWVADSSSDTPRSRAAGAVPVRSTRFGSAAAAAHGANTPTAPPLGMRPLPKQQLYYRPLTDAATVTLVLERQLLAEVASPRDASAPRRSEATRAVAEEGAAAGEALSVPPSRQPLRTLPSRTRSRWDALGEPQRPPPVTPSVSCWERLSSSSGRGQVCKSADAAVRPERKGGFVKKSAEAPNAVMQEIRTLERALLGRPLGPRWQQLGSDNESRGAGSVSTGTAVREQ